MPIRSTVEDALLVLILNEPSILELDQTLSVAYGAIAHLHLLICGQPAVTFKGAGEIVVSKRDGNGDWNMGPDGTNQRFLDMTVLLGRYFKECF